MARFPERQQLPNNPYSPRDSAHDAYDMCLRFEREAGNSKLLLMYARCLGYLILEAPDSDSRDHISSEILVCKGDGEKMNRLAQFYINHLFRLFRREKGCTRCDSSPSLFEEEEESFDFSSTVDPFPKDRKTAKHSALVRDNFRCMATGLVDEEFYLQLSPHDRVIANPTNARRSPTHFSPIFPSSTNSDVKPDVLGDPKTHYAGAIASIVSNYGRIDILNELNGEDGNRLSNGLTLSLLAHDAFDKLLLWFEAIPNAPEHTYRVCTLDQDAYAVAALPPPRVVTFMTKTELELPDPRYLQLHSVICRVAHLSGVAWYLEEYDSE